MSFRLESSGAARGSALGISRALLCSPSPLASPMRSAAVGRGVHSGILYPSSSSSLLAATCAPSPPLSRARLAPPVSAVRRRKTGGGGGGELLELPESSPSSPRRRRKPVDLAEIFREQRVLYVGRPIDGPLAAELISVLLLHEASGPDRPVTIVLACPGGELGPALALRDAARHARCPVGTLALGACSGAAALLLATAASGAGAGAAGRWGEAAPKGKEESPRSADRERSAEGSLSSPSHAVADAGTGLPASDAKTEAERAGHVEQGAQTAPRAATAPPGRSPAGRRRALPHAAVSLRGPWGRTRGRATELAARAAALARSDERIAGMFADATGRAADDIRADMDLGRAFDAEGALAYGLIDEVVRPGGGVKDGAGGGRAGGGL